MDAAAAARGRCSQIEVKFCNWLKRLQGAQTFASSCISLRAIERQRERAGESVGVRVKSFACASLAKVCELVAEARGLSEPGTCCSTFAVRFTKIPFVSIALRERMPLIGALIKVITMRAIDTL